MTLRYQRSRDILEAKLGDELVALDRERGQCLAFNETAAKIWDLLSNPLTERELADKLMAEYEVESDQCHADLSCILDNLLDQGLVMAVQGS